jgi:arylsulfatase A-like enzyme
LLVALVVLATCTSEQDPVQKPAARPSSEDSPSSQPDPEQPPPRSRALIRRACRLPNDWIDYVYRGWDDGAARAYDLALVPEPPNYMGSLTDTSHSGPYDFLQEVPLLFYGPGHIRSRGDLRLDREVTLADLAPTVAELLDFDLPERDGEPIEGVLRNGDPPRLVVTAVIDGGGWNVLDRWEDRWPNIARLMRRGASVQDVVVGSSPSITPAIHTTLSTGAFPNHHKITAIVMRTDDGKLTEAFVPFDTFGAIENIDPSANTDMPTLADLWDRSVDNKALVGMVSPGLLQFGMMGLGAAFKDGDKDLAAILAKEQRWATNPDFYAMPDYVAAVEGPEDELEAVDRSDGAADGLWRGHAMPPADTTPAFAPWENRTMQAMLRREGFGRDDVTDLFYINYKAPDKAGHAYNMIAPEQGDVIESVDEAVADTIDWLDENIGRRNYVFVLTADHGQTPLEAGGWPIRPIELTADLDERFDDNPNGRGIVQDTSASTLFMNKREMKANGVTPEAIARFLQRYTFEANIGPGETYPEEFADREDEPIFRGVIPGRLVDDVHRECSAPT